MTQKERELLLQDICSRLPYGVKCKYYDCCEGDYDEGTIYGFERQEYIQIDGVCISIEEVKPYLLPMSSMSKEQNLEFLSTCRGGNAYYPTYKSFDWLDKNHFDYRGLIPRGLAIDATGLCIY